MKALMIATLSAVSALSLGAGPKGHNPVKYEISFQNITHTMVLTPPIFSLSRNQIDVFQLGQPASLSLEMLAEGGATDALRDDFEAAGVQDLIQMGMPVLPGETAAATLEGDKTSRLNLASMLLPTNDGFVALNGPRVYSHSGTAVFMLRAYDAGTEMNDELCASIPGPQCGGTGFVEGGGEGFVAPHRGTHGGGDLSPMMYSWGEPVAIVTVRVVH